MITLLSVGVDYHTHAKRYGYPLIIILILPN